ncbi:MAG: hypothetical protein AAF483_02295 [Planctomycetota bacterium]
MDGTYVIDQARTGLENMRLDHQMLSHASKHDRVLLRIYKWSEPTQTLGYFQARSQREQHGESTRIPSVRRSTGGGAIIHHFDWTYSLALPAAALEFKNSQLGPSQSIYDLVHDSVVDWLRSLGCSAAKWSEATCKAETCSFLCFERRTVGDLVLGESKIMGSAQRRRKGALLQHGSLLLQRSEFAPSLAGLLESGLNLQSTDFEAFGECLAQTLEKSLSVKISPSSNLSAELEIEEFGTYGEDSWEYKR